MKTDSLLNKKLWRRGLGVAAILTASMMSFSSCEQYDLDEKDPAGWGASIYNYLEEQGNYTNTLKLIDDLNYREVLAKTGSKTLFVADDDAYKRFYANNEWNVKSYDQLSLSQKKMLLLGSMINSSYQAHDLASIEGPITGQSIRRLSSMSVYDTVSVVNTTDLPCMTPEALKHNDSWKKLAGKHDKVLLMHDMTVTPLVYFIEAAMKNNKITNDDYAFLFNNKVTRQDGDASVNGIKIEQPNIKCSNGFIHKMEEVMLPLKNMADVIESTPELSIFNSLLERFSTPYYVGNAATDQYNYLYNTSYTYTDSIILQKRFFADNSQGSELSVEDNKDRKTHKDEMLRFDPGWNTYYSSPIPNATIAAEKDMAVMLVPDNTALEEYWNYGEGQVLKDQFGTWDNVPNDVVAELIRNCQLTSFLSSVPSKFETILNDANDPMGITKGSINEVKLACNGGVYITKRVFPPTSFVSVLYPAIVNETMKIIKWAVKKNQYQVYLNSLNSKFSFFIPTNDALLSYVDPISYGESESNRVLFQFHYDESRDTETGTPIWASRFRYDATTGTIGEAIDSIYDNEYLMKTKLKEILDNHIVIGDVEDGSKYYRTKGGQEIMVENVAGGAGQMKVYGSQALSDGVAPVTVSYVYDQTKHGNGKTYILDSKPIMTTEKSVLDILDENPEMSLFRELLYSSSLKEDVHGYIDQASGNIKDPRKCIKENLSVFNTYHYTVYVPTNAAMEEYIKSGKVPTWDMVEEAIQMEDTERAEALTKQIENFLRYHIQDYALYIGAKPEKEEGYETALINETTNKFERLYATLDENSLVVRNTNLSEDNPTLDMNKYVKANVLSTRNLMAREYMAEGENVDIDKEHPNVKLYTTSSAVVHLIDKVLKPYK